MDIKRAYRFRFYPTSEQITVLAQTFGCARFIYNHMLRLRSDAWMKRHEHISYHETSAALTIMKKMPDYTWLNEVSSVPLQQSLRHLQTAFGNFFAKRSGYPTFKCKDGNQSATYTDSAFQWNGKTLKLAKMKETLNIIFSRTLPKAAKVTTVTVSKDTAGRYFVNFLCDDAVSEKVPVNNQIGIDLGLTHFAILSNGEKIASPNVLRQNETKLVRLQRRLSRKQKGSCNRAKAKWKIARLHAKIADTRKDFLHKLSSRLIDENQVIAMESLAVSNMQKNHCLARSISDAGWGEFVRMLAYKAQWYGRTLVRIDRWYPSSKRCSDCGHIVSKMPLNIREWTCPECGSIHDRDVNAARNVLTAGLAELVCGENVSPVLL
ncbi:transposase [Acidithiobacillus thiooxidans]|uniref:Transposase n=2 Tax=Acidithiobacillus thiooxidans TaxID=930 RepID=A0A1C2JCZ0_ACITH|nr:IS200/IS605 family element RNA-guided endonuclease TnpB [Acidithiobacillus thiooxidans]OCX69413.1 transposase [Acidithiobacillus thiooxidans]OCX86102.1 transposase [Acidithiobacillus thiooxidans]